MKQIIGWDWSVVFSPMIVVLYIFFFGTIFFYVQQIHILKDCDVIRYKQRHYPPLFFLTHAMIIWRTSSAVCILTFSTAFTIFIILLLFQLEEVFSIPIWIILFPIFCFIGTFSTWIVLEKWDLHKFRVIAVILSLVGALFVEFVGLKLDGIVNWSWYVIMSPLFVLAGMIPLGISIGIMEKGGFSSARDIILIAIGACGGVVLVCISPAIVFEILLALKLQGDRNYLYMLVFIPLFLVEGLLLVLLGILNIVALITKKPVY